MLIYFSIFVPIYRVCFSGVISVVSLIVHVSVDLPLPVGEYLESGASMKLTVEITRLLATPAEVAKNELLPASEKVA